MSKQRLSSREASEPPSSFCPLAIRIVQATQNYTVSQRQLSRSFLGVASTLNAVVAFCAQLKGQVQDVKEVRYDIGPNPRVRAVLTSNYDPFLEAAFSTKFIKPLLKPVAAYGSHTGRLDQIPVFHIHGYVPHPAQRPRRRRKPLVKQLVLSTSDYEYAWNAHDAFGTTMAPQIHFLRHYTILFIGFSFTDKYVCSLLEALRREYLLSQTGDHLQHFAMIPVGLSEKYGAKFFDKIGVRPIVYKRHQEIPALLGELYISGLTADQGAAAIRLPWVERYSHELSRQRGPLLRQDQYWRALLACRNGTAKICT